MEKRIDLSTEITENEQVLIKSEKFSWHKVIIVLFCVSFALFVIIGLIYFISGLRMDSLYEKKSMTYSEYLSEYHKDTDPKYYSYDEWLEKNYKDVEIECLDYWDWSNSKGYNESYSYLRSNHKHQDEYDKYKAAFDKQYNEHRDEYDKYYEDYYAYKDEHEDFLDKAESSYYNNSDLHDEFYFILPIGILALAVLLLIWEWKYRKSQLFITDKRAFGIVVNKHIWKGTQRIDLPIDSISAVGAFRLHSLRISSSSGVILFSAIKNRNEIHSVLSKLLVERQENNTQITPVANTQDDSEADELAKFKKLLDDGVISQEEFDAKKKQILGL